ncbi:MAG: LysM peptidoglycan-binding domain-containing protein [Mycobacteriales bacterium]
MPRPSLVRVPRAISLTTVAGAPASGVRLTHRGRCLLLVLVAALVTLSFLAGHAAGTMATLATPAAPAGSRAATVIVHDGDTLWSIARAAAPTRDPRRTVEALRRLNDLDGVDLRPGQRILVPANDQPPTRRPLRR